MGTRTILPSRAMRLASALMVAGAVGCKDKPIGPKWGDHEAAHAARYHPDIKRPDTSAPATSEIPATQPDATTQPGADPLGPGPVGSPVLFVNGDPITVQELLEPIIDDFARQARRLGVDGYRDYLFRKVGEEINNQIGLLTVYQQAKKTFPEEARKVLDEKADDMIKQVISRRFGGIHARYEQHLKTLDLSVADMKERARRQIMVTQFLHDQFMPKLQDPPRRELMKYYQAHLDEFTSPARAELFLIEVPISAESNKPLSQATEAEKAQARQEARARVDRAREELDSGVDFAAVAKRYSKGIHSASGGAWGEISPGTLTKRWARPAEVLFTLEPGQISDVIETDESVFIVKCGQRTPTQCLSFEEAQTRIIARVNDELYNRMSNRYVAQLLERATIDPKQKKEFFLAVVAAAPSPIRGGQAREDNKEREHEPEEP